MSTLPGVSTLGTSCTLLPTRRQDRASTPPPHTHLEPSVPGLRGPGPVHPQPWGCHSTFSTSGDEPGAGGVSARPPPHTGLARPGTRWASDMLCMSRQVGLSQEARQQGQTSLQLPAPSHRSPGSPKLAPSLWAAPQVPGLSAQTPHGIGLPQGSQHPPAPAAALPTPREYSSTHPGPQG